MQIKPLQVFKPTKENSNIQVSAGCEMTKNLIHVLFHIEGEIGSIIFSSESSPPTFKDKLWTKTCFEVFVSEHKKDSYSEWNLSPSKDWAFFSFDRYRNAITKPQLSPGEISIEKKSDEYLYEAYLPVEKGRPKRELDIGLTAVTESKGGELSYWALFHLGDKPDFHRRDSFSWRLIG